MAAKSPATIYRDSVGSNTLITATFSDIDDGDTWDSHITEVVGFWVNLTDDPTTTYERLSASWTSANDGRFTFYTAEASRTGDLYVLAKI